MIIIVLHLSTVFIELSNPITEKDDLRTSVTSQNSGRAPPFCLLLRQALGLRLGPKTTLDIPISFAPEDMRMIEAMCTVVLRREDDESWKYTPTDDKG